MGMTKMTRNGALRSKKSFQNSFISQKYYFNFKIYNHFQNLIILNIYIQAHIFVPNIQNGQFKTTILNKNDQNSF